MTYQMTMVPQGQCLHYWPVVKPFLKPAINTSRGRWKKEYVLAALVTGRQNLWIISFDQEAVGALTTEIIRYPEKKMVMIHFLGGKGMEDWYRTMSDGVTEFARACEADGIECLARNGFWKWFKTDGFERSAVFYEKAV